MTKGLAVAGRPREDFELKLAVFVVTGDTEAELEVAADVMRKEIAFYASTPAYRPVLEIHGWGAVQDQLHEPRNNAWDAMATSLPMRYSKSSPSSGIPKRSSPRSSVAMATTSSTASASICPTTRPTNIRHGSPIASGAEGRRPISRSASRKASRWATRPGLHQPGAHPAPALSDSADLPERPDRNPV